MLFNDMTKSGSPGAQKAITYLRHELRKLYKHGGFLLKQCCSLRKMMPVRLTNHSLPGRRSFGS